MGKLEKKQAPVTGSSSGIGAGVALAFAREGADVVINYPTPKQQEAAEKIAEQVRSAGRKSKAIQADVANPIKSRIWSRAASRCWAASTFSSTTPVSLRPTTLRTSPSRSGTA